MGTSRSRTAGKTRAPSSRAGTEQRGPLWVARACIVLVLAVNLQCAVAFVVSPHAYAGSFQLTGLEGATMVRSMGLLFLMWNVPYVVAAWHPWRHRASLLEAAVMQAIGLVGEALMLQALPPVGYEALRATGERFVRFDAAGLLLLLLALSCVARRQGAARLYTSRK